MLIDVVVGVSSSNPSWLMSQQRLEAAAARRRGCCFNRVDEVMQNVNEGVEGSIVMSTDVGDDEGRLMDVW